MDLEVATELIIPESGELLAQRAGQLEMNSRTVHRTLQKCIWAGAGTMTKDSLGPAGIYPHSPTDFGVPPPSSAFW